MRAALGALADDPNANGTLKALAAALPAPTGWHRETTIAFNSARKWSAASFTGRGALVFGAPDVLLAADDPLRDRVAELAATGRRVLLLARSDAAAAGPGTARRDAPVALVTLTEQVRPDAKETLEYFEDQGVRIKIISGDNPTTVAAIARRVGLDVRPEARGRRPHASARTPRSCARSSSGQRCSAGSRRSRSGRWCRRCSATGTSWR